MKGFVPTPVQVVDLMVGKLFRSRPPSSSSKLLDPGCGTGAFIAGVVQWCRENRQPVPNIVGVESDPRHLPEAERVSRSVRSVRILRSDFLTPSADRYDYIVGNPPYVPITQLTQGEKDDYRVRYLTAKGRFDLYLLFFEQALRLLSPEGRLVFITPEKFLYVETAAPLRSLLGEYCVEEIHLVDEQTFGDLVTYPTITSIVAERAGCATRAILRDGSRRSVTLPRDGSSWLPHLSGGSQAASTWRLSDICERISCGVATGADSVFLARTAELSKELRKFARPTISGRQLGPGKALFSTHSLLVPYSKDGRLLPEAKLGALGKHLRAPDLKSKLLARTCVERKPWYAFHETPPLPTLLRPKILCKDITLKPSFVVDAAGTIVPRHSVYYIVPKDLSRINDLARHLNSARTAAWLATHCQRAATGFLRLQSNVLKLLPVPSDLVPPSKKNRRGRQAKTLRRDVP